MKNKNKIIGEVQSALPTVVKFMETYGFKDFDYGFLYGDNQSIAVSQVRVQIAYLFGSLKGKYLPRHRQLKVRVRKVPVKEASG